METRANFVLIGAFTLLGILGSLGFFVWLASVQIDRRYDVYGILFDDVTGLDQSGDVLFNGIPVGRVIGLQIHAPDPARVLATVEVDATTPVRQNTVAQLTFQGVTGVAYIALSGGRGDAPPLTAPEGELPIIPSRRSTVQALVEDAPGVLAQASQLLAQLQAVVGPENRAHVTGILENLETSSDQLDEALRDFSDLTRTLGQASDQIAGFTTRLDGIGASVTATLGNVDSALATGSQAMDRIATDVTAATKGLAPLMRDAQVAVRSATQVFDRARGTMTVLEDSLRTADAAMVAATTAFDTAAGLMDADLAPVLEDVRSAAAGIGTAAARLSADLPAITSDLTALIARADAVVAEVQTTVEAAGPGVRDFAGRGLPELAHLGSEVRGLVRSLNDAVRRLQQNPAGFLSGDRVPEYRR